MAENSTENVTEDKSDKIKILEFQKPALEAGSYSIEATQRFSPKPPVDLGLVWQNPAFLWMAAASQRAFRAELEKRNAELELVHTATTDFVVAGSRFALGPGQIRAQFPPAGSSGEYSRILPHIALRTSTLPWERSAYGTIDEEPWLVLLVVDEAEIDNGDVIVPPEPMALGTLRSTYKEEFAYRYDAEDRTLDPTLLVNAIRVRTSLLEALMPTGREMKLQAHVRRRTFRDGRSKEISVVFANRLPRPAATTWCFLVSVEGLYKYVGSNGTNAVKADEGVFAMKGDGEYRTLVSLARWNFASDDIVGKNFDELAAELATGTLTVNHEGANTAAQANLEQGAVLLRHELRTSDRTWSWYRGPLSPRSQQFSVPDHQPIFADELLVVDKRHAMFDVSHAAAFELGKALALDNKAFTAALHGHKQNFNHAAAQRLEAPVNQAHFAGFRAPEHDLDISEHDVAIREWMSKLALLEGVPFNYLVPDDQMLPPESLRFFYVDPTWIDALLSGAFSIGGALRNQVFNAELTEQRAAALDTQTLLKQDLAALATYLEAPSAKFKVAFDSGTKTGTIEAEGRELLLSTRAGSVVVRDPKLLRREFASLVDPKALKPRSGILLRSRIVAGWPDMMIDAFASAPRDLERVELTRQMKNLRAQRLGSDVLLLLFEGDIKSVELYLKPEGLHFGIDKGDGGWEKDVDTSTDQDQSKKTVEVTMKEAPERSIDLVALKEEMRKVLPDDVAFDPADFAMQMFEGSAKQRFVKQRASDQ